MPKISRCPDGAQGRCGAVAFDGLVYAVAMDRSTAPGIAEQPRRALREREAKLTKAESGKTGLLQATVYLQNIHHTAEMDAVWCDWIGDEANWPQRACIGIDLPGDDLIEIVVVAAQL